MLWHLNNQGAEQRREALRRKGWRIPTHLFAPGILPGTGCLPGTEGWLWDFFELGSDRTISMNGPGPIPANSLARHVAGWPEDEAETFRHVIRQMDRAFLSNLRPDGDMPETDNPARDAFRAAMR